ncbi:MAG: Lrp/AsnC family transcriptional regulator [Candidatus Eisenbacteria bacterium]|nr:Lrp/AsnC family transcriptional regulator [Candidatus Eisenbacteria bacterium]
MAKKQNKLRKEPTRRTLDRMDLEILAELQNNARLSNKELASRVGLAPSSCLERVRRLLTEGTIRGFHAEVEPAALGIGLQALIAVRLRRHSLAMVRAFRGHAAGLPEMLAVYHLAGAQDFLLHVAVRDVEHLRALAVNELTSRPEVDHVETSLIFEHSRGRLSAGGR